MRHLLAVMLLVLLAGCGSGPPPTERPSTLALIAAARKAFLSGATAIDLDGDGKADWTRSASSDGGPLDTEHIHTKHADIVWLRTKTRDLLQIDRNRDGAFEYDRDLRVTSAGYTVVVTEDRDGDFVADTRVQITASESPDLSIVYSFLHDGSFVPSYEASAPRRQMQSAHVDATFGSQCADVDPIDLQGALDRGAADGIDCMSGLNEANAALLEVFLASNLVEVGCFDNPELCGQATGIGFPADGKALIFVNPSCPDLGSIFFHELLHFILGGHLEEYPDALDPEHHDPVYACQSWCFGNARDAAGSNLCDRTVCMRGARCPQGDANTSDSECNDATGSCSERRPLPYPCDRSKLAHDPKNCGSCGRACDAETVCQNGVCKKSCTLGCSTEENPCCPEGEACVDDKCVPSPCNGTCAPGSVCCHGQCQGTAAFDSDPDNCGGCATACAAGQACHDGQCEDTCTPSCGASYACCGDGVCHPAMYGPAPVTTCCAVPSTLVPTYGAFYACGEGYECCASSSPSGEGFVCCPPGKCHPEPDDAGGPGCLG